MTMGGNLIINGILVAILYVAYSWTPWASLAIASIASFLFSYVFLFDKEYLDEIAKSESDKFSLILGAGISYLGVIISIVMLMSRNV